MRCFLDNFKETYNKAWPFGQFPAWEYYPSTGTHVGTDFVVPINTSVFAPVDGEMYKAEYNKYKGNVGVYIFNYKGVEWGLELCHLKELPKLGKYKEGDPIAYSGNTGGTTTGAHLHTVLHRHAMVTKNYQQLRSREDFVRLEQNGDIVDCFSWFCENIENESKPEIETRSQPKALEINITEEIIVRDNFELKTFTESVKKFITHVIGGWFSSDRSDLSPDGVSKERIIDRKNNKYKEKIVDVKTGRVIRDIDEKLTDHKNTNKD